MNVGKLNVVKLNVVDNVAWEGCTTFGNKRKVTLNWKNVRQIGTESAHKILSFVDHHTKRLFGEVDLEALLYEKFSSVGVFTESGELVGMASLHGNPNILSVPPWTWGTWFRRTYGIEGICSFNSLWIHYMAFHRHYMFVFMKALLQFKFRRHRQLKYIMLLVPPGVGAVEYLDSIGTRILPIGYTNAKTVQNVYIFLRETFTNNYKLRRAVEEDNDDLVPLINTHDPNLQRMYGNYYISEMLTTHQDSGRQLVVSELNGLACAVMCLNEAVNYNVLNEEFELLPYNGLRKGTEEVSSMFASKTTIPSLETTIITNVAPPHDLEGATISTERTQNNSEEEFLLNPSEESIGDEDDFSIVNVSSAALLDIIRDSAENITMGTESFSDYSINAQFNELCTQMLTQRARSKRESVFLESKYAEYILSQKASIVEYLGQENAFSLEIAASPDDHLPPAVDLLLEAAFECFPDRDYCVLTVPAVNHDHELLRNFSWVPHRPFGSFPHELFVLHRNAIASRMSVRRYSHEERDQVVQFLAGQAKPGEVMSQCEQSTSKVSIYMAFLFLCEDQVVGLCVITEEMDIDYLYYRYEFKPFIDREKHVSGSYGMVESMLLSPIFHSQSYFFIRELHRQSDLSLLFYRLSPADVASTNPLERPIINILHFFLPIFPRKIPEYALEHMEDWVPSQAVIKPAPPASMFMSTPRTASMRRLRLTHRIVVVGGSDTAISFLETLFCTQNMNSVTMFSNVTLVTPHGLPYQKTFKSLKYMFFLHNGYLDQRHMDEYCLKSYVNVVQGVMTSINRREKYVVVNEEGFIPYDLLFLMCGEQFQLPQMPSDLLKKRDNPDNVFVVNTMTDVSLCLSKLHPSKTKFNKDLPIVVYGHRLEAYCAIAALLTCGVEGKNIILVDPFPDTYGKTEDDYMNVSLFNDGELDDMMIEMLRNAQVKVYESYRLVDWCWHGSKDIVTHLHLESKYRFLELECQAALVYGAKCISQRTFMAIIRAGLVFDGHLVIDPECRTNDPSIYGCGSLTKYSRQYYADNLSHRYYNSAEVGRRLGRQIRKMLFPQNYADDVVKNEDPLDNEKNLDLIPRYVEPIVTYCTLPGKINYFCVRKPGKIVPLEVAMTTGDYGVDLITGSPKELHRQGYFRLHINQYKTVETITCVSRENIDIRNLKLLYGKHEKLLNNLITRFEKILIPDLFQFFKQPWCYAIYHDHFNTFINKLNDITEYNKIDELDESLERLIYNKLSEKNWISLSTEEENELQETIEASNIYQEIEHTLLEYLQDDREHLPMYAHPMCFRMLHQEYQYSPLFLPQ